MNATLLASFNKQARDLLYEQRHAASPLAHAFDHFLGQRMTRGNLTHHARDPGAIEGAERDHAVMRAQVPGRAKLSLFVLLVLALLVWGGWKLISVITASRRAPWAKMIRFLLTSARLRSGEVY